MEDQLAPAGQLVVSNGTRYLFYVPKCLTKHQNYTENQKKREEWDVDLWLIDEMITSQTEVFQGWEFFL